MQYYGFALKRVRSFAQRTQRDSSESIAMTKNQSVCYSVIARSRKTSWQSTPCTHYTLPLRPYEKCAKQMTKQSIM
ncbi:hypothetical protein [Helicobacter sp.]|uniref:hypothetical protein n=1 Tax=Helicobacter sp. TaxID=218 RepID=UPI002A90AAE3|nr:hypothetical protein [Helicobacter sp.]MDY5557763.1 hypothetical protein [Helicobacter sp.]